MANRAIFYILGMLLFYLSLLLIIPFCVSLYYSSLPIFSIRGTPFSFFCSIILSLICGLCLRSHFKDGKKNLESLSERDGFCIVTLSWILVAFFGSFPLYFSGTCAEFVNAYFETMSGFTTTGATIFKTIETIPPSILFWRCMTQWLGGMGIIILTVAILPEMRIGGYHLFRAEIPGGSTFERIKPRISETAKVLWGIYCLLSLIEVVLLFLGGMTLFDAFCHTFTTMSTGGFSTKTDSVAHYNSAFIRFVIIFFMIMAGANFGLHYVIMKGHIKAVFKNLELRFYLSLIGGASLFTFMVLLFSSNEKSFIQFFGDSIFQVVSIVTTTGFMTADFDQWPNILRIMLVCLMFVGGCAGSTGGSIKVIRILILSKFILRELQKLIQPRAVIHVKVGEKTVDRETLTNILAFMFMFIFIFITGSIIMAGLGMDLTSAVSSVAATLGNVGPGLGSVGATGNYADINFIGKWVLVACMLLGRLEIYSVVILLLPLTWKEK